MSIQIVKCQTKVITVIGNIKALITGVCIRGENITYELSYFHNGLNVTCWLSRFEFEIDTAVPKEAGFNKPTTQLLNERT